MILSTTSLCETPLPLTSLPPGSAVSYSRGAGYATQDVCVSENTQGCEQYDLLYFPLCANGFNASGCCICSPLW